jgi:hypothetical protein
MSEHWFELNLLNLPRSTTKKQWNVIRQWQRKVRRMVEEKLPIEVATDVAINTMIYGTGILYTPEDGVCESINPLEFMK